MRIIGKNRWLVALLKTLLLFAFVHISILVVYFTITKDVVELNMFNILDIDLFFPQIDQGGASFILSTIVLLVVYLTIFTFFTTSDK